MRPYFDDFSAGAVADECAGGVLQTLDTAHVDTHAGIVFQCTAAGGDFGVAIDDADFFAQLVDEDADGVRLSDNAGQLAQGLAHQAGLQADMAVAHLALNFGAGHHGGNGVDNDCVNRAGAHKGLANFHGLFTGVRLADQQAVDIDTQGGGVGGVEGVLNIDESDLAAHLLASARICSASVVLPEDSGP